MEATAQVNVGNIIADAFDNAVKDIFRKLASAAVNGEAFHEHPAFAALDNKTKENLASVSPEVLKEFLSSYSGFSYSMNFLPGEPLPTFTKMLPIEAITGIVAGDEPGGVHPMGGTIGIGIGPGGITVGGSWTF